VLVQLRSTLAMTSFLVQVSKAEEGKERCLREHRVYCYLDEFSTGGGKVKEKKKGKQDRFTTTTLTFPRPAQKKGKRKGKAPPLGNRK